MRRLLLLAALAAGCGRAYAVPSTQDAGADVALCEPNVIASVPPCSYQAENIFTAECCAWDANGCSARFGMLTLHGKCGMPVGVRGHENIKSPAAVESLRVQGRAKSGFTLDSVPDSYISFRTDPYSGQVEPEEIARSCRDYLKRWKRK